MSLAGKRIVLTGASGGIGSALARELAREGAALLLVGRRPETLSALAVELAGLGGRAIPVPADLRQAQSAQTVARRAREEFGGVDILVNNAGATRFGLFQQESLDAAEQLLAVNLLGPMRLTQALLPEMLTRGRGQIVNIGSTFGSLAFPGFSLYAASKFGLRGWSEALRRELAGSGVDVCHLSPRATRTAANDARVEAMNAQLGTAVDSPEAAARQLCRAIARGRRRLQLGAPETLFTAINALAPALVDRALGAKLPVIRRHAQPDATAEAKEAPHA